MFKYDPHALRKTLDGVTIHITKGKVTAIVGASAIGTTLGGYLFRHLSNGIFRYVVYTYIGISGLFILLTAAR